MGCSYGHELREFKFFHSFCNHIFTDSYLKTELAQPEGMEPLGDRITNQLGLNSSQNYYPSIHHCLKLNPEVTCRHIKANNHLHAHTFTFIAI